MLGDLLLFGACFTTGGDLLFHLLGTLDFLDAIAKGADVVFDCVELLVFFGVQRTAFGLCGGNDVVHFVNQRGAFFAQLN